jgi:hypothetical protein
VPVWDHLWLDYGLVRQWVRSRSQRQDERTLVVCESDSPLPRYFERFPGYDIKRGLEAIADRAEEAHLGSVPVDRRYETIFLHIYRANMRKTRKILKAIEDYRKPGGQIVIFVEHKQSEIDPSNFSSELTQYLTEFLPADWTRYTTKAKFVGGRWKRRLRLAERRVFNYIKPVSPRRFLPILAGSAVWPAIAALTAANNIWHRKASSACPEYCSSFLISLESKPVVSNRTSISA